MDKITVGIITACFVITFACLFVLKNTRDAFDGLKTQFASVSVAEELARDTANLLRQQNEALLAELTDWKAAYDRITQDNTDAKRQIEVLENANREICEILSADIPDELWLVLFPKGSPAPYCLNPS